MDLTGYKERYAIELQTFTTQFLSQVDNSPTYDKNGVLQQNILMLKI